MILTTITKQNKKKSQTPSQRTTAFWDSADKGPGKDGRGNIRTEGRKDGLDTRKEGREGHKNKRKEGREKGRREGLKVDTRKEFGKEAGNQ